ncbi:MAG: hypothetical protein WBP81_05315 [Solirubrobacteraceae bacterium]
MIPSGTISRTVCRQLTVRPVRYKVLVVNDETRAGPGADDGTGGLVSAVVARRWRRRRSVGVCIYLIDAYCLGVKNAAGPDDIDDQALRRFIDHVFGGYHAPPEPVQIELVRDLVLGAPSTPVGLGSLRIPTSSTLARTSGRGLLPARSCSDATGSQPMSRVPTTIPDVSFARYAAPSDATASLLGRA